MPKPLLFLFLFFTSLAFSQERSIIYGSINANGALEQLHILNKNSGAGTITGKGGLFQIAVQLNDTLVVSGIQFYYQEMIINETHLKNKTVTMELLQRINELDEVTVKSHSLTGNLRTDASRIKDSLSRINGDLLNFSGIDFSLPHMGAKDHLDRVKPPSALGPNHGIPGFQAGGDILGLVLLILEPLKKPLGKIGETKRKNKKRKASLERSLAVAPNLILSKYRDLIENELKIPRDQVQAFISYCGQKGVYELFLANKSIEVIDLFIREKPNFLKSK